MSREEIGKEVCMSRAHRSSGVVVAAMSAITLLVLGLGGVAHAQPVAWSYPDNLGDVVNSTSNEDLPHLAPDGLSLYFISDRPGLGGFDIFVSRRFSPYDPWGIPRNLGPMINGTSDERGPCLSRDGHYLFFSSNRAGGYGSQDLWMSYRGNTFNDFGWQPPVNLGPGVNTNDPDFGAALIENEWGPDTLLFGRRVSGGQSDIYMSQRQWDEGPFEDAVRVWQLSMPFADDLRPTVRLDGLELYFHSNRPGSQERDLWVSWRPSIFSTWWYPQNVGFTVNTPDAELYPALSPDARTLVFSSNRSDSRGGTDLYVSTRESEPWPYYDYWPY